MLLVDPFKMTVDGYKDIALLGTFCAGRLLEKKFIRFEVTGLSRKGVILFITIWPAVIKALSLSRANKSV